MNAAGGLSFIPIAENAMKNLSRQILVQIAFLWIAIADSAFSQTETNSVSGSGQGLVKLSIEELMNLEVTSVSKTPERLSVAAAAVTVLTGDDIRRSGATSIPEALRMVPGLDVARVDSHSWAISSRGLNNVFANKLLVLIDGRSVYTPLYAGVFWNVQDLVLEDIDRIEVIRGPGATQWGANAVNGVVNIISKSAKDTQGLLVTGGGGSEERGFGAVRYGGKISDTVFYRADLKYFNRDNSVLPGAGESKDSWDMYRGGFRVDWEPSNVNLLTVQGDLYYGHINQVSASPRRPTPPFVPPSVVAVPAKTTADGGNILGRWTHTFSVESDVQLQAYYDRTSSGSLVAFDGTIFREDRDTVDVDAQHRFALGEQQEVIWGLEYRASWDRLRTNYTLSFNPSSRTTHLVTGFIQDEVKFFQDRVHLTLGTKLEHNDYTGFEIQPSARILWNPVARHTLWGSVSRAVRTPSRVDNDVRLNTFQPPGTLPFPSIGSLSGNSRFGSERLIAYELGYRVQPLPELSFDAALFYNEYTHLRSAEFQGLASPPPFAVANFTLANNLYGESYGGEIAALWKPLDNWRIRASYSYQDLQLHRRPGSTDIAGEALEGNSPDHQLALQSSIDLPGHVEFDWTLRYVDALRNPALAIPSYVTMDVRVGWRPCKNFELSIVGQNLLDNQHPEFRPNVIQTQFTEVERSIYAKITLEF